MNKQGLGSQEVEWRWREVGRCKQNLEFNIDSWVWWLTGYEGTEKKLLIITPGADFQN